jgi:ATP-dependent Clp protease protease subunit
MKKLDLSMLGNLGSQKVDKNAFVMIFDPIDEDVAKQVIQFVIETNYGDPDERPEVLNVLINSPGGSLTDAFAIIDVMKSSTIPVRTIGLGQIASAALMIFLAGTKGQRVLTPNTSILSHRWSGGSGFSKSHELFSIAKEFDLTSQRMLKHYVECTGMKEKDVLKHLLPPEDVFLSAEEALKFGICDQIALLR